MRPSFTYHITIIIIIFFFFITYVLTYLLTHSLHLTAHLTTHFTTHFVAPPASLPKLFLVHLNMATALNPVPLDSPQPVYNIPPLATIPDGPEDKPVPGKLMVCGE